jgi:hypothetical protein
MRLVEIASEFFKKGPKLECRSKVREMENYSMVFNSNFDYYQRVAHKKFVLEKCSF